MPDIDLQKDLLAEAVRLSGNKSESETINEALQEYVRKRRQTEILKLFGKVDFDPEFEYKKARKLR